MPVHPPRRTLAVRIPSVTLVLSIALGMWLGFLLILVTAWVAWHYGYALPLAPTPTASKGAAAAPPRPIDRQPPQPPAPSQPHAPLPSEPGPGADEMFQHYQQNLHSQALRDAEAAARANPANQANPKCQFWLEQAQTAATDDSREQVARFCN